MGLFGFVGKILGGAAKVAGNLAMGNPLGAVKAGLGTVGSIIGHKQPMGATATKINVLGRLPVSIANPVMRGNATQAMPGTAVDLRQSPVLPGGAIASPRGALPKTGRAPNRYGGGSSSGTRRRSKRSASSSGRRKRSGGRKLKFGSPAWRKKYMKPRRRKSR